MPDRFDWISRELQRLDALGVVRKRRRVTSQAGGSCEIDGRCYRNFSSNDYLDLAHDPRVVEAAARALAEFGAGAGSSALVTGRTDWHARLEEMIADFEGQPAAVIFPTGYAANIGTVAALAGKEDAIFSDALNHASLIDGCRLSGAKVHVYDQTRLRELEESLRSATDYRRRFLITDTLFSMDGIAAPLAELCDLAEKYGAEVIADEAHATGVFGQRGRGLSEELGLEARIAVRVGTLSKAVGSLGGFVAGATPLVDWLWNRARTQMFSTALPPATCAAACAAIEIIQKEPERRAHLAQLSARLRSNLAAEGLAGNANGVGPVIPVILGTPDATMSVASGLQEQGMLVAAIRPPTVPEGTSRLRISVTAAHTLDDIDELTNALLGAVERSSARKSVQSRN
ncbi:MAG: 8-amino-7-oxononanoate synthase [Planctomycetaceae bacterium]